jgi:hypothetical protein
MRPVEGIWHHKPQMSSPSPRSRIARRGARRYEMTACVAQLTFGRRNFRFNLDLQAAPDQRDGNRRHHGHRDAEPATVFH